jgi:hypothetical protein
MRGITERALAAFREGKPWSEANTAVLVDDQGFVIMALHGKPVARRMRSVVEVRDGGYRSVTTGDRISAVARMYGGNVKCVRSPQGDWLYWQRGSEEKRIMPPGEWVTIDNGTAMDMLTIGLTKED